jgi:glycosyltransferase involved in cell wall biosynthesis
MMNLNFFLRQNKITPETKLNVLSFCTHESVQTMMDKTEHNFYLWRGPNIKDWDSKYRPLPKHHHLLDPNLGESQIPSWLVPDLILSQNKFGQYPVAKQLASRYMVPLVTLEHCLPVGMNEIQIDQQKQYCGDVNVFISEYSKKKWRSEGEVIHHGVDIDLFKPNGEKKPVVLSVVNDWRNRGQILGFDIWQETTKGLPTKVVGATPGLSEPAKNIEELVGFYQESLIFYSTHRESPIPFSILEACAAGCCLVSTTNCMIPEVFEHKKTAFLGKTPQELRYYLDYALKNPEEAKEIGQRGRELIIEKFSQKKYVDSWNKLFYETVKNYR